MPLLDKISSIATSTPTANEIGRFLLSGELQEKLLPLKIFMIFCLFLFVGVTVYLMLKTNFINWWAAGSISDFFSGNAVGSAKFAKRWGKIRKLSHHKSANQRKIAVLNAYSLLESSLASMGHTGDLAEKLSKLDPVQVSGLADLKKVQKECDEILKNQTYIVEKNKADDILDIFERAFRDMELL